MSCTRTVVRTLAIGILSVSVNACSSDSPAAPDTSGGGVTVAPAADQLDLAVPTDRTVTLTATVRDRNGVAVSQAVSWSSGNNTVATVSNAGLVTGLTVGTALITASAEGRSSGTATITVISTPPPPAHLAFFARFVAMGNSLAAGFESAGIDVTTQGRSWPVLLAAQTGATFVVPTLSAPGCPAPFTGPLGPRASTSPCAGRVNAAITNVDNVAVPGERIADALITAGGSLHTLLIGARTQAAAMRDRNPTFVAVELGNNDALEAALSGVATSPTLTIPANFSASVDQLVTQLKAVTGLRGAALLSVMDPTVAPLLQPGAYFFLMRDGTGRYKGKLVNANCSPVNALGQPNSLSANLLSELAAVAAPADINCDPTNGTPGVLSTAEIATIRNAVTQYNASLQAAATANGWAFVDVNAVVQTLMAVKDTNGRYTMIRKCQDLATAATAAQFQAAVLNSCPVTGATGAPNVFGLAISFDGVHPSALGAREIAKAVIARVNTVYALSIPALAP